MLASVAPVSASCLETVFSFLYLGLCTMQAAKACKGWVVELTDVHEVA